MKSYQPEDKRVVGFFGHRGAGKTSLVEACLYNAGATTRLGSVESKTLHLEGDPDALERQTTMHANVGYCEWDGVWIGVVDTPGDANFWGATHRVVPIVDAAVLVVSSIDGIEPQTLRCADELRARGVPFAVFVTKADKESQDLDRVLEAIKRELSTVAALVAAPIGLGGAYQGSAGLITNKAYLPDGKIGDVPEAAAREVASARELLIDAVAAADDHLMEKYLEEGSLSDAELAAGLKAGFCGGEVVPVLVGVPTANVGGIPLLELIKASFPSPLERPVLEGVASAREAEPIQRRAGVGGLVARVFGSHHDPFAGNLSYARIYCGSVQASHDVFNATRDVGDRPSHIFVPMGGTKHGVETKAATAGDLVALTKLKHTHTGDTLCSKDQPIVLPAFDEPPALLKFGIAAVHDKEEEKVAQQIQRMIEEDPSLVLERNAETKEMLLGGLGQLHIDYVVHRLQRANLQVVLHEPKVPYRESLRAPIRNVEGKHKKQSGGSGQYGVCFVHVEPLPRGTGIEFVDQIVGGSIPRQYIASVEKGVREALHKGPLTGHEVVDVRVSLYDGKYHSVDSSDIAFQIAGRKAMREAFRSPKAKPVILEPYMLLNITSPADMVGDVIGDLNSRRGRVQNMENEGKRGKITASVPMVEVLKYTTVLKALTSGQGAFSMRFDRYEEAPPNITEQVIAQRHVHDDDD